MGYQHWDSSGYIRKTHTSVERFQFLAGDLSIVHAIEKGCNAGIVLAPEVVRNCVPLAREN
jgi:hypothetical protein